VYVLKKCLIQPLAEAIGDPLLEGLLATLGLDRRHEIGEQAPRELDRAQLLDHVHALQRVLEELVVPIDPAPARALEELLLHDLVPEVVDLLDLGEEAVAAEIEAVAVADLGARDAADVLGGLEHDHRLALLGEQIAAVSPAGPAPSTSTGRSGVMSAPGFEGSMGVISVIVSVSLGGGLLVQHRAVGDAARASVVLRRRSDPL